MSGLIALRDRRDQVIAQLSAAYAEDLFDVDELERRLDVAHGASTVAELEAVVADLAPTTALVPSERGVMIDDPSRAVRKRQSVVFSSVERQGRWVVPRELDLRVWCGSAELDLRDASLAPGVTTIDVSVWMGNLEITLPPELAIDVDVSAFLGSVEERHRVPPTDDPTRPLVRLVGVVRFGNIEISTRLRGESKRDASRRARRERKQLRGAINALPPGDRTKS